MIVTLTGANSFGLKSELDSIVAAFLADHDEMGLERIDGEEAEYERLYESLTTVSFLADAKLVVIRAASANKRLTEQAAALMKDIPETTGLVFVEPKLDKRGSFYKLLKKQTDFREFNELDQPTATRWLVDRAKQNGGSISPGDARYLVDRIGLDQRALSNEIDKLCLYDSNVTRQTIDTMTERTPQSTVFELLEAAFSGNTKRAMALYDEQRAMKVEPQQIIAMLAWQLHIIALIKTAGKRTPDQVAKEAKLSPYVVKKSVTIANKIPATEFKRLLQKLLSIDTRLKRESLDADEALRTYLLQLGSPSRG